MSLVPAYEYEKEEEAFFNAVDFVVVIRVVIINDSCLRLLLLGGGGGGGGMHACMHACDRTRFRMAPGRFPLCLSRKTHEQLSGETGMVEALGAGFTQFAPGLRASGFCLAASSLLSQLLISLAHEQLSGETGMVEALGAGFTQFAPGLRASGFCLAASSLLSQLLISLVALVGSHHPESSNILYLKRCKKSPAINLSLSTVESGPRSLEVHYIGFLWEMLDQWTQGGRCWNNKSMKLAAMICFPRTRFAVVALVAVVFFTLSAGMARFHDQPGTGSCVRVYLIAVLQGRVFQNLDKGPPLPHSSSVESKTIIPLLVRKSATSPQYLMNVEEEGDTVMMTWMLTGFLGKRVFLRGIFG
ncbi:unnamed protein product, partial [Notodromas monacha]